MNATFTVGVFDACFSGSFDLESLKAKGLRATPGFNAFAELPQEVLSSQGTMWFVSSRPDQVSYEDNRLGGVFLHFFLDGMEKAPSDGFGVTLDEIWEYARARTQAYTSKTGRPQTPEKMVRNLKSSGPLYFSFLQERRATLVFDKEVAGHFVVRYDRSQLTEIFEKRAGHTAELPLYAADVVLERRRSTGEVDRQTLRLEPGARVRVRMRDGWSPAAGVGFLEEGFAKKGDVIADVVVTSRRPSLSLLVEGGYVAVAAPGYSAVANHQAHLRSRFDYDRSAWGASFSYGQKEEDFPSWGYDLKRTELAVFGGPAWDLDLIRLGAELEAFASYGQVRYRNTDTRDLFGFGAGIAGTALLRLWEGPLGVYLSGRLGARSENVGVVAPIDGDKIWAFEPLVFLGISLRVL